MTENNHERKGIAALPLFVSPVNCEAVLGLKPREFREFIRAEGLPIIERGKNRLVRASDLVERLEAKAKGPAKVETNHERLRRIAGLGGSK